MKIAFLILAHGKIEQLNCFINQLLKYKDSYVFIHLDQKCTDDACIINDHRVIVAPEHFDVQWGDSSQIKATNYLMKFTLSYGVFDYYSIHSGVDMAIKPVKEFAKFLEIDHKTYYANMFPLPHIPGWSYKGGMGRICLKWPHWMTKRTKGILNTIRRYIRGLYGRLYAYGVIKGTQEYVNNMFKWHGGSNWITISGECMIKMLRFIDEHKGYTKIFEHSFCADEIYYNTILKEVATPNDVVEDNNHLRYIDWSPERNHVLGGPTIFNMDQLEEMLESDRFFARKFDMDYDANVVNYLKENV